MFNPYEGFSNIFGWQVAFWLDNNQEYAELLGTWIKEAEEMAAEDPMYKTGRFSMAYLIKTHLGNRLEEFMIQNKPVLHGQNGIYNNLLSSLVAGINYYQVAEHVLAKKEGEKNEVL